MGDVNARVCSFQILSEELILDSVLWSPGRRSKDEIVNGNGSSFLELCDDFGLLTLNGRGCGEREGQFTFIGGPGCSVNYLCCVSFNCNSIIGDLQVLTQSFSDHLPIYFSVVW